jgi:transcriptional regulator with XRE-family HTH domain
MTPRRRERAFDCENAIIWPMTGATLIKEARRRSGLSQRELAARTGRKQSTIARWEGGAMSPSFDALLDAVRACGLDVELGLTKLDDSYRPLIEQQRRRAPLERLTHLSGIRLAALVEALDDEGVRFVLAGPVAAVLHGSPVGPGDRVILVPDDRPRNRMRLHRALAGVAVRSSPGASDADSETWSLREGPGTVEVVLVPPGTRGYPDLSKEAVDCELASGLSVRVASVLDLARIENASGRAEDRLQLPALRALLEPDRPSADILTRAEHNSIVVS